MTVAEMLAEASGLSWDIHDGLFVARLVSGGSVLCYHYGGDDQLTPIRWLADLWFAGQRLGAGHGDGPVESYSALVASLPRHWAAWLAQQCQEAATGGASSKAHDCGGRGDGSAA